jgi:RimJ/RimL family protein N-acetyltransferase
MWDEFESCDHQNGADHHAPARSYIATQETVSGLGRFAPAEPGIRTERLELRCMTPAFMHASLSGDTASAERYLNASIPGDWPDIERVLALRLRQLEADPRLQPWLLRAICHCATNVMIGHAGFHTAPGADYLDDWLPGAVEFGFTVFPDFRGQGYALEAARALMGWAHDVHALTRFVLTIAPDNVPSRRIATRLGFVRLGSHIDDVDGEEDVFGVDIAR